VWKGEVYTSSFQKRESRIENFKVSQDLWTENIHLCLHAGPQVVIGGSDLEASYRALINVQTATKLDVPSCISAYFAVVDLVVKPEAKDDITVSQSLFQLCKFAFCFGLLGRVLGRSNQLDGLNGSDFYGEFA
jgi:hypothetical protein